MVVQNDLFYFTKDAIKEENFDSKGYDVMYSGLEHKQTSNLLLLHIQREA